MSIKAITNNGNTYSHTNRTKKAAVLTSLVSYGAYQGIKINAMSKTSGFSIKEVLKLRFSEFKNINKEVLKTKFGPVALVVLSALAAGGIVDGIINKTRAHKADKI